MAEINAAALREGVRERAPQYRALAVRVRRPQSRDLVADNTIANAERQDFAQAAIDEF